MNSTQTESSAFQKALRIFTISSGKVEPGAEVSTLHLKGAGVDIPAIVVGESGRGRKTGVVPVASPPKVSCPDRGRDLWTSSDQCPKCDIPLGVKDEGKSTRHHPDEGMVSGRLMFAVLGETKAGQPKFFSRNTPDSDDEVIAVFRTNIGFRGSNAHTGDRVGWRCSCGAEGTDDCPRTCPTCGKASDDHWTSGPSVKFGEFPGRIIAEGMIAQGDAGRAGSGQQVIAVVPKGVIFRTAYSGRLYGRPSSHYYTWDGEQFLSLTWEERCASEVF